jgi:hypothetical protein
MSKQHFELELSRGSVVLARVQCDCESIYEAHNAACHLKNQLEAQAPRAKFAKHQEGILIATRRLPDA